MSRFLRYYRLLLLAVLLFAVACAKDDEEDKGKEARLRFIHTAPKIGALDVLVDDDEFFREVVFGEATRYRSLDTDSEEVRVTESDLFSPFLSEVLLLEEDNEVSVLVIGDLDDLRLLVLEDDNDEPRSERVKLRIIMAATELFDPVDVFVLAAEEFESEIDQEELAIASIREASFSDVSEYLESRPGRYFVRLVERAQSLPEEVDFEESVTEAEGVFQESEDEFELQETGELIFESEIFAIEEGQIITAVLVEDSEIDTGFKLVVLTDRE